MRPLHLLTLALLGALPVSGRSVTHPGRSIAVDSATRDSILHLLNRAAWGPRPGDVARVASLGIDQWIARQLDPNSIADPDLDTVLTRFDVLRLSPADLVESLARERAARLAGTPLGDSGPLMHADAELQTLAIVRPMLSERQLYEVMVDFWTNHFNVYMPKGVDRALMADYVESAIRAHALGRFEDLLLATAHHPAMLVYLDNARSIAPTPGAPPGSRGINENYARELLELHTLGVDGGYTQADVIAVARILTGWGIGTARTGYAYSFRPRDHDRGEKRVLDRVFPAGHGEDEGEALLRWLAARPETMRHVSAKLCARFVADDPPDGCIDAAVHAWEASEGDMRVVVSAILHSPEFWASERRHGKTKTPLEFVVSAARAIGARPDTGVDLPRLLTRLGEPIYLSNPPTGYPEQAEMWINSGALFDRFNTAVKLATSGVQGLRVDLTKVISDSSDAPIDSAVVDAVLQGRASPTTRAALASAATGLSRNAARRLLTGLALGSPDFQRQ